jgi:opacity protein-like surface antigen
LTCQYEQTTTTKKINTKTKTTVMKKIFFAALIATTVFTSAFAADTKKISARILHNFKYEYSNAADVNWTLRPNFAKASFTMDGKPTEAFYDLNGELIGTSEPITLNDLPVSAKRAIAKRYAGYDITEAIRFDGKAENAYYISAENEKEKVIVRVGEDEVVTVFDRTKKS